MYGEKDNIKWNLKFDAYKDYLNKFKVNPTISANITWNGQKVSSWLGNQRNAFKKGTLSEERVRALDEFNIIWRDNREETFTKIAITKQNNKLAMINNMADKNKTPLSKLNETDKKSINKLIKLGFTCCDDLLNTEYTENISLEFNRAVFFKVKVNALHALYPEYPIGYKIFLYDIIEEDLFCDLAKLKYTYDLANLKIKVDKLINRLFKDRKYQVITMRYGLINDNQLSLREVGESFGVQTERARQIISDTIDIIRRPNNIIWLTNDEYIKKIEDEIHKKEQEKLEREINIHSCSFAQDSISKLGLNARLYGSLIRNNINTIEQFMNLTKQDVTDLKYLAIGFYNEIAEKQRELEIKFKLDMALKNSEYCKNDIIYLDLSNRAYNALKRSDINTIEQLMRLTEQELHSIHNVGGKCSDEMIEKRKYVCERLKIPYYILVK